MDERTVEVTLSLREVEYIRWCMNNWRVMRYFGSSVGGIMYKLWVVVEGIDEQRRAVCAHAVSDALRGDD